MDLPTRRTATHEKIKQTDGDTLAVSLVYLSINLFFSTRHETDLAGMEPLLWEALSKTPNLLVC